MTKELTAKQRTFVDEYLIDLNATQAAIRAGYSKKTAQQMGAENLSKPVLAEAIQTAKKARSDRTEITADRVLQELAKIGFSDIRGLMTDAGALKGASQWGDDVAASISSIEVVTKPGAVDDDGNRTVEHVHKIKTWDKKGALDSIGRHLGMFVDRQEHSGPGGKPIAIEDLTESESLRRIAFLFEKSRRVGSGKDSGGGDAKS